MKAFVKIACVIAVVGAFLALLTLLRFKPWQQQSASHSENHSKLKSEMNSVPVGEQAREALNVGFLPVTCHLTCPVTDYASQTSRKTRFESQRFTDFPTVVETMKAGRLDATFMVAPLAMKLRSQGIPIKIVYLGHRDGSTLIVQKNSSINSIRDLAGKVFAIPKKFSNQNLVVRKLMEDNGMSPDSIQFVELPPPDMPAALANKSIDAYFVGEPHAAKSELNGNGRVLYHAKDIWPNFISCVLVVTEKLIRERPAVVGDLVRGIAESGEWIQNHREEAAKIAAPFFRQDEKLIRYVLTSPGDRVSYTRLTPEDPEFERMQDMALKMGVLYKRIEIKDLVDAQFVPESIAQADIKIPL